MQLEDRLNHNVSIIRLKLIFSALLRALSSAEHPVVLVLDDLQWSDHASRDVIQALLADIDSKHTLIICMHRAGDFQEINQERVLFLTRVSVKNLGLQDLNNMLTTITSMDATKCMALSEIVLSKTLGNPYHAVHFLEMLIRRKHMVKDDETDQWKWDVEKIAAETDVSDNVALIVERKIKDLPKRLQIILHVAAHLGFRFDVDVLDTVLFETIETRQDVAIDDTGIDRIRRLHREKTEKRLQIAVKEGLIEVSGEKEYKFRHDRVQETIRAMIPVGRERQVIQAKLGNQLYKMARADNDQKMLMLAVDQLNAGQAQLVIAKQRVKLVRLNLEVSKIALSKAALMMAREYLKKGLSMVDDHILWLEHYPVALDVYSALAELGDSAKDVGRSEDAVKMVLKHGASNLDKMRAHHATIERLISSSSFDEAIEMGCKLLSLLGHKFPTKPGKPAVVYELVQVKRIIGGKSNEDFLELPITHDQTLIHVMRILQSMALAAYFSSTKHKLTYGLATLRNLKLSCNMGLSNYSIDGFSGYAIMLSMLGNFEGANRFGKLAIEISRKLNAKGAEARSSSGLFHLVFPWKRPLKECIEGFRFSFRQGMATSETNIAFAAGIGAIAMMHHTGSPLLETEERMRLLVSQLKQYRQNEMCRNSLPFYQVILNLKDPSEDPSALKGDAMDIAIGLTGYTLDEDHAYRMEFAASFTLAYYFEDWSRLEYSLPLYDGKYHPVRAHYTNFLSAFSAAMAYFELFRRRQKRVYRKRAEKKLRMMQQWLNGGNVNCLPLLSILQAESLSLSKSASPQDVLELYDNGALEASAMSFVQIEATAYERAACFLTGQEARSYLTKALRLYHAWGADAKIVFLEKKHKIKVEDLFRESRRTLSSSMTSGFSSRQLDLNPTEGLLNSLLSESALYMSIQELESGSQTDT